MLSKKTHLTIDDKEYPLAFTLNVMENIQETYGSIENWSKSLESDNGQEPKLKDVIWTFRELINEGIDIENEEKDNKRLFLTHKQVGRLITNIGISQSGALIKSLIAKSNDTGTEKNEMTTQNQN